VCNDIPNQVDNFNRPFNFMGTELAQQRIKNIKKFSNRKNAPTSIKNDFKKLLSLKYQHKDVNIKFKDFKKTGEYKNIIKTSKNFRKKIFQSQKKIRTQEHKILSSYPILITY
jgi:hypothetical protein